MRMRGLEPPRGSQAGGGMSGDVAEGGFVEGRVATARVAALTPSDGRSQAEIGNGGSARVGPARAESVFGRPRLDEQPDHERGQRRDADYADDEAERPAEERCPVHAL